MQRVANAGSFFESTGGSVLASAEVGFTKGRKTQQKRRKEIPWHLFYKPDRTSEGLGEIAIADSVSTFDQSRKLKLAHKP
jgi:hypothetical protein